MNRIKSNGTARNRKAAARVGMLGAIGAALFACSANAAVVIHDNRDGTFKWERTIQLLSGDPIYGTFLDIRKPPTQSGERKPGTFGSWFRLNNSSSSPGRFQVEGEENARAARSDEEKLYSWNGMSLLFQAAREYEYGEYVESSHSWRTAVTHYWSLPFDFGFEGGTPLIADLAYLGVRVGSGNTYNYGWILFENWTTPLMWAYETTPNTPIQIPVPNVGTVAILAIAAPWIMTRRRT